MVHQRLLLTHELANDTDAFVYSVRIDKQMKKLHLGGKQNWLLAPWAAHF